ncbi:nucleotidyltransferase domain-containing protein [Streptomyces sp. NPDC005805]|uniref:nucleotidyltransferase domain-containing protein n=1 Tax=Streptomyces sp. NPDC005805 TaxID=3157068 RepID=UPI0033F887A0
MEHRDGGGRDPITTGHAPPRGLNPAGTIAREGSPDRVPPPFAPVVAALREEFDGRFGGGRGLHGLYLYGSVPRGTARPGVSDLDALVLLDREPTARDRADAADLAAALDAAHPAVDGVGVLLHSAAEAMSDLERYDLGFFVACLCTPLLGEDLGARLPAYRPTSLLARETNGDLARVLPRWRTLERETAGCETAAAGAERAALVRRVARRIVRTGFTLVMPRWGGWTSDLELSAELFGHWYPERAGQMRRLAAVGLNGPPGVAEVAGGEDVLRPALDDLGPWLAAEYTARHGTRRCPADQGRSGRGVWCGGSQGAGMPS